jgi:AraC-like DNA-binding protein
MRMISSEPRRQAAALSVLSSSRTIMHMNAIDLLPADIRPAASLPDWLLPDRMPDGSVITAMQPYTLRVTEVDQPALIVPLRGRKVIMTEQLSATVGAGCYLMLHRSFKGTVRNLTEQGLYRAWCIAFPWRLVSLARSLLDAHSLPPAPGPAVGTGPLAPLLDDLQRLLTLPKTGVPELDAAAYDHALLGVLLGLARIGESQFRLAQDPTLASRIRLLFGAAPGRDWTSADVEERLHMSGATLRRRLAMENTSLRVLLRDVRLDHGLQQLQATRRPLKAVAQACGYRSVPSFSRQFLERFGVDPAAVANGHA